MCPMSREVDDSVVWPVLVLGIKSILMPDGVLHALTLYVYNVVRLLSYSLR